MNDNFFLNLCSHKKPSNQSLIDDDHPEPTQKNAHTHKINRKTKNQATLQKYSLESTHGLGALKDY